MKKIALLGALALASASLVGCAGGISLGGINAKIATTAQADLPTLCTLAASAHASFATVAATGTLKPALVSAEAQSWAAASSICANPPTDIGTAMASLSNAYAAIVAAKAKAGA